LINLSVLNDISRAKKYHKGSIFARQSHSPEMYIILRGEAGVYLNHGKINEKLVSTLGPGSFFNETAFLNRSARLTTVALQDVIALPVCQNTMAHLFRSEPKLVFEIFKELCGQLDDVRSDYEKLSGLPWTRPDISQQTADKQDKTHTPLSAASGPIEEPLTQAPEDSDTIAAAAYSSDDEHIAAHFSLFPEGHGSYKLPLNNEDKTHLMNKSYVCPICRKSFKALKVKTSKLYLDCTDNDLRSRYKNVEPLYYDIVTCPGCLFSALNDMFDKPDKTRAALPIELKSLKHNSDIKFGADIDTYSIFAGYYLALICAPNFFLSHHLITARLLLKLSWLYHDCGDTNMETQTVQRALDAFLYVYQHIKIQPNIEQQICLIIGELLLKQNELQKAKDFFFKARTNHAGGRMLHQHAENRMLYIRETVKQD
jgi:uncharacterized protein (DUF2225 family)/CRP-like cAMP-binding protein